MLVFAKGDNRLVLAIPSLGVAFKFPRIRVWDALNILWWGIKRHFYAPSPRGRREPFSVFLRRQFIEYSVESNWTFKSSLGRGITDNWRERRYYKHASPLGRLLLQPTYLSILGLVNVQKYGKPVGRPEDDVGVPLYHAFFKIAGQALIRDGHHWVSAANFHLDNGSIRVLDYGNLKTQAILDEFGLEFLRRFVPPDLSTTSTDTKGGLNAVS
jgi:hypothetical protein